MLYTYFILNIKKHDFYILSTYYAFWKNFEYEYLFALMLYTFFL